MSNLNKVIFRYAKSLKGYIILITSILVLMQCASKKNNTLSRERISINQGWKFYKYDSIQQADKLIYDERPEITNFKDDKPADAKPAEAVEVETKTPILKAWILPSGNDFIKNPDKKYIRPDEDPGKDFSFVQYDFDDSSWEKVSLPHDWAIQGPFYEGWNAKVGGGMGRFPSPGIAWYRKKLNIPVNDKNKSVFLDIDGAMSYAMVWINGHLAGGWPYGYASWRVDLTPYIVPGGENQLAIRLDNPNHSSRWYPGGGIYRNVWLVKTNRIHIGQFGVSVQTHDVSKSSATINLKINVENKSDKDASIAVYTQLFVLDNEGNKSDSYVAASQSLIRQVSAGKSTRITDSIVISNPLLWGSPPMQKPNRYVAVTTLKKGNTVIDQYETPFGIRSVHFDADSGIFVNGEHIYIKGANQHHDLGALGVAFNQRAAERQLEILREMGCNAVRTAHNPPAPELLDLTDRMGFLVFDEIFDCWERKKTPYDFHLIFPDWYEQDIRAFIRRDRNHPSVIMWGLGNEVGEQYTGEDGAELAEKLQKIAKEEDLTRPTTLSMNFAKPPMPLPGVMDVISLNYQGEGIRNAPAYAHLKGINTPPLYPSFHEAYPDKVIVSSENASAFSSRGEYIFPVFAGISAPVENHQGGNPETGQVSSYELYTAPFGSSADKVFGSLERHPYVAGGFVWSGWDYLGEPTPYYQSRSSYSGIIDLAGFKKERFYLYQAHWRPDFPMVHILPHWNWPNRIGEVVPVHVFTSGDEAELFLNGKSLGKKKKVEYEYRLRWDDVVYTPGILKVVAYKNGKKWAEDVVKTTDKPARLMATADRNIIQADGKDLSFITVQVTDKDGLTVPDADNLIEFDVVGAGKLIATDNGDPTDFEPFPSHKRKAFNGLALVIICFESGNSGAITIRAKSQGLKETSIVIHSN